MKGLTGAEAAMVEAYQKAGIRGHVVGPGNVGSYTYSKMQRSGSTAQLRVAMFLAMVELELDEWPEQAERERVWLDPDEAAALVDEPKLAKLLRRVPRLIRAAGVEFTNGDAPSIQLRAMA